MGFREVAAAELSALGRSTSEYSDRVHRDLEALQRALETAVAALNQTASAGPVTDATFAKLVETLASAADAEVDAATQRTQIEGQRALDEALEAARVEADRALLDALRAARADAQRAQEDAVQATRAEGERAVRDALQAAQLESKGALDQAVAETREELTAQLRQQEKASAALDEKLKELSAARDELGQQLHREQEATASANQQVHEISIARDALSAELRQEKETSSGLGKQLKETSAAVAFADAVRKEIEAAHDKESAARTSAESEAVGAGKRAEAAEALAASLRQQVEHVTRELSDTRLAMQAAQTDASTAKEHAAVRIKELEAAVSAADGARIEQLRALRGRVVKIALEPLEHLRTAFQALNGARSTEAVLTVLLEALGTEFSRVALFDVTANRIEGHRHVGFDAEGGVAKIVVPLSVDSPLSNAVRTGRVQGVAARDLADPARLLFGGAPTFVLAVPVIVRNHAVAVMYADDSEQAEAEFVTPERRIKFAEALLYHAIPLLTRLAVEEEALAELREYAASVVKDLELVYEANAASQSSEERRVRLQHNLEYARQRFAERVEGEDPAAARLLDEQIGKSIVVKAAEPFGRDLAEVSGIHPPAEPETAKKKAAGSASNRA